jgi:hypothetical protein
MAGLRTPTALAALQSRRAWGYGTGGLWRGIVAGRPATLSEITAPPDRMRTTQGFLLPEKAIESVDAYIDALQGAYDTARASIGRSTGSMKVPFAVISEFLRTQVPNTGIPRADPSRHEAFRQHPSAH